MIIRRLHIAVLLVLLAQSACAVMEEPKDKSPILVSQCGSSSDCGGTLVCDLKVSMCVSDEPMEMTAWLRLLPPEQGLVAVEEQYPEVDVSSESPLNLALNRPVAVVGRVLVEGDTLISSEVANISAVAEGMIPDLKIHAYAKAGQAADFSEGGLAKAGFEFLVNRGVEYDVKVYLTGFVGEEQMPPYHKRLSFNPDFDKSDPFVYEWDIAVPPPEEYLHITGRVVTGGDEPTPFVGAKVFALSEETGNESSTVVTGEDGRFDILVQPLEDLEQETYLIHLRPSSENELVPRLVLDEIQLEDSVDIGDVVVEGLQDYIDVSVYVVDSNGTFAPSELAETAVRFTGQIGGGALRVDRLVDSEGKVEVALPRANYVLSVSPPSRTIQGEDQPYGIHQQLLKFHYANEDSKFVEVALAPKPEIHGLVFDSSGEVVPLARVEATYTGKGLYPDAPLPSRVFEAETDETGRYRIGLDAGQYTIVVVPPEESGQPRKVERDIYIPGSQQRTFELSEPSVVSGTVMGLIQPPRDNHGESPAESPGGGEPTNLSGELKLLEPTEGPAPGVKVELYDQAEADGSADGLMPIPIASAWSDENGDFVLVVPAE